MDLILKETTFDQDKIKLKEGKKCTKILYTVASILVIGISLKITNFSYSENDNFIFMNLEKSPQLPLIQKIDSYFRKLKNYYSFIDKYHIKVKKHNRYYPINDTLYITMNNLKEINHKLRVQIFTI